MNARPCNHCGSVTFGDACTPCRERVRAQRQDPEPTPIGVVTLDDLTAALARQAARKRALDLANAALKALLLAAKNAGEDEAEVIAAGQRVGQAVRRLEGRVALGAEGIELLRRVA